MFWDKMKSKMVSIMAKYLRSMPVSRSYGYFRARTMTAKSVSKSQLQKPIKIKFNSPSASLTISS